MEPIDSIIASFADDERYPDAISKFADKFGAYTYRQYESGGRTSMHIVDWIKGMMVCLKTKVEDRSDFQEEFVLRSQTNSTGKYLNTKSKAEKEYNYHNPPPVGDNSLLINPASQKEYTGGSVSYYKLWVPNPTSPGNDAYLAECNDIIEGLGMTYAEGNAFKAIWRMCAARNLGKAKEGYKDDLYDSEKVVFFGNRLVEAAKKRATNGPSNSDQVSPAA